MTMVYLYTKNKLAILALEINNIYRNKAKEGYEIMSDLMIP
ncbi:MAG: hypothetical protein H6Q70_1054 [Firmicutes bacterium]|nr:hypothetical protein [Bacillota bacterium]